MEAFITSKPIFEQAEKHYETALEEYARPAEDVVPYMVCESAYQAVIQYLRGFILANGRDKMLTDSPELLLDRCRSLDPKFHELNIQIFNQKDKNDDTLMDMNIMNHYMQIMNTARKLVGVE